MAELRAFVSPLVQSDYKSAAKKNKQNKNPHKISKKQAHSEVQPEEVTD